ncbi:hypothetical protein [Dactylosporangium sp. NPDC051541]|uniref:hypothetical protein n=1 Tax=Dactylosporangium sp. NPDC051541 TaxID=3363977 RepID=UPI003793B67D
MRVRDRLIAGVAAGNRWAIWVLRLTVRRPPAVGEWPALAGADLVAAAGRGDGHPVVDYARRRILDTVAAHGPGDLVEELGRHALEARELAAWCRAHDLEPAEPTIAAALLLVTGHEARYHAVDPGHGLLRAAFADGGPTRRTRLLAALAAAGLDPAVVAGNAATAEPIWDLPIADAVAAVARFGAWRPAGPAAAALFERLAAADPQRVAAAVAALPEAYELPLPGRPGDVALSADGTRLAYHYRDAGRGAVWLVEADARTGAGLYRYRRDRLADALLLASPNCRTLAHLGDAVVGIEGDGLYRYRRGECTRLIRGEFGGVVRLGAGGRFVAIQLDRARMVSGTADGVTPRAPDGPWDFSDLLGRWLSAAPDGRHIVVGSLDRLVLRTGDSRRTIVQWARDRAFDDNFPETGFEGAVFPAPDRLVTLETYATGRHSRLTRWRIAGATLEVEAEETVPPGLGLDIVDGTGLLVLTARDRQGLRYYDAATLEPAEPGPLADATAPVYPRHAAGRSAFVTWQVELPRDAVRVSPTRLEELARRPLRELTPADAELLDAAAKAETDGELYGLLRDCVHLRYGHDIVLGRGPRPGDDDIAIGGVV